jgi:hypothetical protein
MYPTARFLQRLRDGVKHLYLANPVEAEQTMDEQNGVLGGDFRAHVGRSFSKRRIELKQRSGCGQAASGRPSRMSREGLRNALSAANLARRGCLKKRR